MSRTAKDLHDAAMALTDQASLARMRGEPTAAPAFLREALATELQAAEALKDAPGASYWRGLYLRSAGSMAMQLEDWREAERIFCLALTENPQPDLAQQIRLLLRDIYLAGHLLEPVAQTA